jgi:peptidyl-prolyl cis-trans isomerase C
MKEIHQSPMTKRFLTLLSISLSAGLIQAQTSAPKSSGSPDLNKVISSAVSSKGSSSTSSVALKDPVAVVNGEKISKADLEKNFSDALAASGANVATLNADQKMQGYRQILDGMIMEKLVDKQAAAIQVDKADVDAQLAKIKSQFPSEEVFLGEMKKSGLTLEQFTANLTRSIRQQKWMQSQVQGKDSVTEADAKKFYDANTKEFTNPDLVKASHILFRTPENATPEQQKVAENKAKSAIVRANKGEPFDKLASELSEEPGAAQRGGDLGYFPKDRMVPEFATAAFAQKPGTVSATPVKTKFGYHVIKVTDKKPAGTATFEEAKAQILQFLQAQKRREIFRGVMQELRQGAKIESNLPAPTNPPAPVN